MKRVALLITFVILGSLALFGQSGRSYVGYKYKGLNPGKTLPNGIKHLGGGMIGEINTDPVYGISQVQRGRSKMLWLEVSTGQDDTGVTGWKVLDVITFAPARARDHILIAGDPAVLCSRRGNELPNLVGIGRIQRRQRTFTPSSLWIADIGAKRFKPLAVQGVKCVYSEP